MVDHAVPFPSVARFGDDRSGAAADGRPEDRTTHGRVNSSPSVPDWSSQLTQSGTRPRLGPLDLAVGRPSTPGAFSPKFLQPFPSPSSASAQNSPTRRDTFAASPRTRSGSPRRPSVALLTPPLTPSSSFNSASTVATDSEFGGDPDVVPSTPPDGGSPLTWGKLNLRRASILGLAGKGDSPAEGGLAANTLGGDAADEMASLMRRMDLTPKFEKKLVFGDLIDPGVLGINGSEDKVVEKQATRFIQVHHTPSGTTEATIRSAAKRLGVIKVRAVVRVHPQGTIVVVLYDLRDAMRIVNGLQGKTLAQLGCSPVRNSPGSLDASFGPSEREHEDGAPLRVEYTDRKTLEKLLPHHSNVLSGIEGTLIVEARSNQTIKPHEVQKVLASLGDLMDFKDASQNMVRAVKNKARAVRGEDDFAQIRVFVADYYDSDTAVTARQQMDGKNIFYTHLYIHWASELEAKLEEAAESEQTQALTPFPLLTCPTPIDRSVFDLSSPPSSSLPLPESPTPTRNRVASEFKRYSRGVTANEGAQGFGSPQRLGQAARELPPPQSLVPYGSSWLDSRAEASQQYPTASPAMGMSHDDREAATSYTYSHYPFGQPAPSNGQPCLQVTSDGFYVAQPAYQYPQSYQPPFNSYGMSANAAYANVQGQSWTYPTADFALEHMTQAQHSAPSYGSGSVSASSYDPPPGARSNNRKHPRPYRGQLHRDPARPRAFGRSSPGSSAEDAFEAAIESFGEPKMSDKAQVSEKNQLNLDMIEQGLDTRTTVMIKNIPNKMNDKDLMEFIARVCPRRIDFLYLRIDFQNTCNVGYAFVNFISVQDLLHFAKTQLGVKWNMYSSEKVLQMSYANYQGKEALVEKFKNSSIMDEKEAWRPKIFFSDGPNQGLPEPFPAPTHLRRKERSASNRGMLYVPNNAVRFNHHYPGHRQHHQQHQQQHQQYAFPGGQFGEGRYGAVPRLA